MAQVGRPTSMTPAVIGKLTAAFALDARVEAACAYAGISKQTYYTYIENHPEFLDEIEQFKQTPYLTAVQSVVKNLEDPDFALKYLERKAKGEFSVRQELTGADGEPLSETNLKELQEITSGLKEVMIGQTPDSPGSGQEVS